MPHPEHPSVLRPSLGRRKRLLLVQASFAQSNAARTQGSAETATTRCQLLPGEWFREVLHALRMVIDLTLITQGEALVSRIALSDGRETEHGDQPLAPPPALWPRPPFLYSIRIAAAQSEIACARCCSSFLPVGPTGFADDEPICDLCLLESCGQLGMLLALASISRAFGGLVGGSRDQSREALFELAAFARIYERYASRFGQARRFRLPEEPAETAKWGCGGDCVVSSSEQDEPDSN